MTIQDLIANLSTSEEPQGNLPMVPSWTLVIDSKMVREVQKRGSDMGQRLCGYKGCVYWTTDAMMEVMKAYPNKQ